MSNGDDFWGYEPGMYDYGSYDTGISDLYDLYTGGLTEGPYADTDMFDWDAYFQGLGQAPAGTTDTGGGFLGLQGIDWTKLLTGLGLGGLGALGTSYAQQQAGVKQPTTTTAARQIPGFGMESIGNLQAQVQALQNLAGGSLLAPAQTPEQQQLQALLTGDILGAQYPRQTLLDLITQGTMPTEAIGRWEESIRALEGVTPQRTAEMMAQISPLYGMRGSTEKIAMENIWKLQEEIARQKQALATQIMPIEERQRAIKAGAAQQLMAQYPGMMGLLGLPKTAEEEKISQYFTRMAQPAADIKSLISAALGYAPTTATVTGQPGPSLSSILLGQLGGAAGTAGTDILKNLLTGITT